MFDISVGMICVRVSVYRICFMGDGRCSLLFDVSFARFSFSPPALIQKVLVRVCRPSSGNYL